MDGRGPPIPRSEEIGGRDGGGGGDDGGGGSGAEDGDGGNGESEQGASRDALAARLSGRRKR